MARQFMGYVNTPEGLATFFVFALVIMAIVYVVFSAAGGALGASMFARRRNRATRPGRLANGKTNIACPSSPSGLP